MSYKTEGNPLAIIAHKDYLFQVLKNWYERHKRDLPWRHTKDPYLIWISEIILQQTRVAQGLPYYQKFTEQFPDIEHFAQGSEDEILRLWQGLGYYSRARNMMQTAQQIMLQFDGKFPSDFESLKKLKGVGDYTAAAIASFAFQQVTPVVDGNVYRFLARLAGISTDISSSQAKKEFTTLASSLISAQEPDIFNQAIMEFGALQCIPTNPDCTICPLTELCYAYQNQLQDVLPVKLKKTKVRTRYLNYLVIQKEDSLALRKRPTHDVWAGLYEFVLIETTSPIQQWEELLPLAPIEVDPQQVLLDSLPLPVVHQLSHQKLFIQFWPMRVDRTFELPIQSGYIFYEKEEVESLPKPVVVDNYLKKDFF